MSRLLALRISRSDRAYDNYDHICEAAGQAFRSLTLDVLRTVCRCDYIERVS